MKIALFLGAGASVPFGKPTTIEMKEKLRKYGETELDEEIFQSFLSPYEHQDIEYVLQSVRDILKFSKNLGGQYFSKHAERAYLNYSKSTIPYSEFLLHLEKIEKRLEKAIYEAYRWNHDYDPALTSIYDQVFNFLKENSESIMIFTTNYDRAIEEFCNSRNEYHLIDGFSRDPPHSELSIWDGNYDIDSPKGIIPMKLFKLHGSLNWKEHTKHGMEKIHSESLTDDPNLIRHLAIMPTRTPKDEEESSPFSDLFSMFSYYMEKHDACIVIGFSFRDQKINEIFKQFIVKRKPLIVISPSSMENVCENFLDFPIPDDFDKNRASFMAPHPGGHIWCIPDKLNIENIQHNLNLSLTHIKAILDENKKNNKK